MVCKETWWSNKCDNKDDIRYDPEVSPDISELHPLFSKANGYWKGSNTVYDGDFNVLELSPGIVGLFPIGPRPYPSDDVAAFYNVTIDGTRWEQHDIYVHNPAPLSFCQETFLPPNAPLILAGGDGVCGVNGFVYAADAFKTSTHEKTNMINGVSGTGSYLVDTDASFELTMIPVGDVQLLEAFELGESIRSSYTWTFDKSYNSLMIEFSSFELSDGKAVLNARMIAKLSRVTEEEWVQGLATAMEEKNVTTENKNTFGTVPTQQCVVEDVGCPTLEMWCDKGDASPSCGETPYVEETTVNAGVVAGITVTAAVVVIALIVSLLIRRSKRKLAEQKERLKDEFAKRIVGTFNIGKSGEALTMEGITEEFKLLDSGKTDGGDGLISKTEFKDFIMAGKAGEMKDSDFEALFALIDEDGSGEIDFTEFSAFMGHIKSNLDAQVDAEEFNEA